MEPNGHSCLLPLAAWPLPSAAGGHVARALDTATSPLKTRVGGSRGSPSGRSSRRGRRSRAIATGCRGRAGKTVLGRGSWPNRDPLGEEGSALLRELAEGPKRKTGAPNAGSLYVFCSNQPISCVDALGLTGSDVLAMFAMFRDRFIELCKKCQRSDLGWPANYSEIARGPGLGCVRQSELMEKVLADYGPFQDWTFAIDPNIGKRIPFLDIPSVTFGAPHKVVTGVSSDPGDPYVIMDTWRGCFEVKFASLPGASWKKCFECNPCAPRNYNERTIFP